MNNIDKQYIDLLKDILENGTVKADRTGVGTMSVFGRQMRFDMNDGFPLLTTKKIQPKAIIHELLWFLKGGDNIKYLVDNGVNIWNEWPWVYYCKLREKKIGEHDLAWMDSHPELTLKEFAEKIKSDDSFAEKWGKLGPVYGKQWVNWVNNAGEGINQIDQIINDLKTNPDSRRIMVNAWNVGEIKDMKLPPCHYGFQLWTKVLPSGNRSVSLMFNMRSVDVAIGWSYDCASYAILLHMIAQCCDMVPGELLITSGDTHIYLNHVEGIKTQLDRVPYPLPKLWLNPDIKNIYDFKFEDIRIDDYVSHPFIKLDIAI